MNWRLVVAVFCLAGGGALAQSLQPIPITSSGPTPWIDVKAYGAKGDGVADDTAAIQAAINACPANGCTIYFGAGNTYLISTGLTISSTDPHPTQGIRLLGECGAPGTHDVLGIGETCSHIVTSTGAISAFVMLTASGVAGTKLRGLVIEDLGFQDQSSNRAITGGIRLLRVESFNLTDVHCRGIQNGYCFLFDGGGTGMADFTQFGVVVNPDVGNTKFPVQTKFQASEINFFGGNLSCAMGSGDIADSIGMASERPTLIQQTREASGASLELTS